LSLSPQPELKRALGLPLLVFYGLGVTVGAGIFALIGEIVGIAGSTAPLAFLLAGLVAAATARTYAILAPRFPKAGGAAVYANEGLGSFAGRVVGIGVVLTGIVSSAVISLAFAGYVGTLVPFPPAMLAAGLVVLLTGVAAYGIRESIAFAAIITLLEVGTLVVVAGVGMPELAASERLGELVALPSSWVALSILTSAAAVAFFAFIGFEDIVNLAEETRKPEKTLGPAIAITLGVSTLLYVVIAAVAASVHDREAVAASEAPLADLFAMLTGLPAAPISVIAAISMVNGILVQLVMASRVLYGMASDGLLPAWIGKVSPTRRTPIRATVVTAVAILALTLIAPMLSLAQATGYITLLVFAAINIALVRLSLRPDWRGPRQLGWWGILGAVLCLGLIGYEAARIALS
jgi:APA family basic amino acid/polyamine antiporter